MRLLKSGNYFMLALMCWCSQAQAQEIIDNVGMEKNAEGAYKVQFVLNPSRDMDVSAIILKIFRRRDGNIEEIFTRDVAPVAGDARGDKLYTYLWKPESGLLKAGDELRATVSVSLKAIPAPQAVALPNKLPHADAGKIIEVQLPVTKVIALNGRLSRDDDGRIVSSYWRQASGPTNLTIMNRDSLFTYVAGNFQRGAYIFELSVTDDRGAIATSRTMVTVKPAPVSKQLNNVHTTASGNSGSLKHFGTLNGGAAPAVINLLVPGLGHYFVSGDQNGENRHGGSFFITAAYAASIGGAFYFRSRSDAQYKKYNELANFRDYQRDANGEIIGVRGASQAKANEYFTQAKAAHRNSLIALGLGGSILVGDLIYTLVKGSRNKRQWQQSTGAVKPQFLISTDGVTAKAGIQLNF